jgi:hypothetical protein
MTTAGEGGRRRARDEERNDDSMQGRTLTGKGRRVQRRRHARADADGQGTRAALNKARFYLRLIDLKRHIDFVAGRC